MSTVQQVLIMETCGQSLRSEAFGWTWEHPKGASLTGPVGFIPSWGSELPHPNYPDPIRAIAAGWKLISSPLFIYEDESERDVYEWWFTREER